MLNRYNAFLRGDPRGISQVTRIAGRLSSWVENGCKCTLSYVPVVYLPARLTATGTAIGTMTMDLVYADGMFAGFTANSDVIPTLFMPEIIALAGKPLADLGGGGADLSTLPALDLADTAVAGTTGLASDAGHRHKKPTPVQISALSVPLPWNANTNNPTLASGVAPDSATAYVCTVSGATVLDGQTYVKGDIAVWDNNTTTWAKIAVDGRITTTWLNRGSGDYHGQEKRFSDVGTTGDYIGSWDSVRNKWRPAGGRQPYHLPDAVIVASTANPTYAPANVTLLGNVLANSYGVECDLLVDATNGAGITSRVITYDYGSTRFVNDTASTNRRKGMTCGFRNRTTGSQLVFNKYDSSETDWRGNYNGNASSSTGTGTMSEDSTANLSIARSVQFNGITSAINVVRDNIWIVEG